MNAIPMLTKAIMKAITAINSGSLELGASVAVGLKKGFSNSFFGSGFSGARAAFFSSSVNSSGGDSPSAFCLLYPLGKRDILLSSSAMLIALWIHSCSFFPALEVV